MQVSLDYLNINYISFVNTGPDFKVIYVLGTGVFTCVYPKGTDATKLTTSIKLTVRGPGEKVLAIVPVEVISRPPAKKKLAICLGRVYSVRLY